MVADKLGVNIWLAVRLVVVFCKSRVISKKFTIFWLTIAVIFSSNF